VAGEKIKTAREAAPQLNRQKSHPQHLTIALGSALARNGVSTVVIQKLLEHSSPDLTNTVYTNVGPVLRQAIDTMPAGDWLRIRLVNEKRKDPE
jgi:hypothetical protein